MKRASFLYKVGASLIALLPSLSPGVVTAQTANADPYFGMHLHRADSGTAWPNVGIGAWRLWDTGTRWPELEPQRGRWEFSKLDRLVAMARLTKVDVLLPLGSTPTWASARPAEKSSYGPGQAAEPNDMNDWRRYVRTVAERYKGRIRHYDFWNEVNEKGFYTGSVEKMVELTCETYKILHAVDPENRLVSPSFIGAGSEPDQLENFLRKGGKACIDVVGYHFYVPHRDPEEIVPLVQRVRAVMQRQGVGQLPLWNTESGWWMANADDSDRAGADKRWRRIEQEEGAAVVARSLILGRWAGLERFYWYAWDNKTLGLLEPSTGALKPAGVGYGTVARWIRDVSPDCMERRGIWVCNLPPIQGQTRRIAWTAKPAADLFALPKGEQLVATERLDGQRIAALPSQNLNAELGYAPVLLISTTN